MAKSERHKEKARERERERGNELVSKEEDD